MRHLRREKIQLEPRIGQPGQGKTDGGIEIIRKGFVRPDCDPVHGGRADPFHPVCRFKVGKELQLPISTNDSAVHYQPIDLHITFEFPRWTENENKTSIRIACWYNNEWYNLESQIYDIIKNTGEDTYITGCNVIFLIPTFADGTEQYFIYYTDSETSKPSYKDHVIIEDGNYSWSPIPELSAQARYYGIKEDGYCIYAVGQEGQLLDRSCAQVVVKQKKDSKQFDLVGADQIVSFAFCILLWK